MKRSVPSWMYTKVAPYMGKQHVKNAEKLKNTIERGNKIKDVFRFFVENEWIYESKRVLELS